MTVSTTTSRADYTGNGTTTAFAVPFYFLDDSHLTVLRTQISTGVITTLAITTNYTVSGAGNPAGGTVTCVVAPTTDQKISILRNVPFTQLNTYVPNDPFPAASHERALDKLTMEVQQLDEAIDRALSLPPNTPAGTVSAALPTPEANKFIAWNGSASGFQNLDASTLASVTAYATAYSDTFSGTGAQTIFTLSAHPGSLANLRVSISGVVQRPTIDYTWVSGTTLTFTSAPAAGTNNILVQYATATPGALGITDGTNLNFIQSGAGASTRTIDAKLKEVVSVLDFGADATGATSSVTAFNNAGSAAGAGNPIEVHIPRGTYNLASNPAPTGNVTWVVHKGATFTGTGRLSYLNDKIVNYGAYKSLLNDTSFYNGIYEYLEDFPALSVYGRLGLTGVVQSAGGAGTAGEANIAVSAFAAHNLNASAGGAWGLYSTVLRASGVNGATHGMEIDVANFGSTVQLFPNAPVAAGQTTGAWICTGGETTEPSAGGSPGVASVALAIIQNDAQAVKTAKWDKGILFHSTAINGADGTGGSNRGVAIAFASGHQMRWYNNSNQDIAEIVASNTNVALAYIMNFSQFGLLVTHRATGQDIFAVRELASAANGIHVTPTVAAGGKVTLTASGADTNIGINLAPKGTGNVVLDNARPLVWQGSTSGTTTVQAAATASGTLTLPAATDTLVGRATTDTLSNKTLASPAFSGTISSNATFATSNAFDPQLTLWNQASDAFGPYFVTQKSRGASGAGSAVVANDFLGTFLFKGHDSNGTAQNSSSLGAKVTSVAAGNVKSNIELSTDMNGSVKVWTFTSDGRFRVPTFTVGTLPAGGAGDISFATNGRKNGEGAGAGTGVLVFHDGTAWRACDTGATVAA